MSSSQPLPIDLLESIHDFVVASDGNQLTEDHWAKFEQLLRKDDNACRLYVEYMNVSMLASYVLDTMPEESPISAGAISTEQQQIVRTPPLGFLSNAYHGTIGFFSQELPFSLLIAAVLTSLGLWFASMIYVSSPDKIAKDSSPPVQSSFDPTLEVVGRITGMVDCKWSDPNTETFHGANVLLGRKYAMASGLMEITYKTGAKVILQGPVTYEVKSMNGGFLLVGKLTGKVEVEAAKGFSVRTPNAIVTDLGTEFGIEVGTKGTTMSHVFHGTIKLEVVPSIGATKPDVLVLGENESARVEADGCPQKCRATLYRITTDHPDFVRQLAKPTTKVVDLLDIVAGGDGSENHRERGIDPTTGKQAFSYPSENHGDTRQYHPVIWTKLIDGVFVPNSTAGPVQLDSAGHTSDIFPNSKGSAYGTLWPWAATAISGKSKVGWELYKEYAMEFMPNARGMLEMHPDKGITFSLDAVRHTRPGMIPVRFQAVAGVVNPNGAADIWVFVDGRVRFRRFQMCNANGPVPINIELKPNDRFLTLASTCGGKTPFGNWLALGDPRLELAESQRPPTEAEKGLERKETVNP